MENETTAILLKGTKRSVASLVTDGATVQEMFAAGYTADDLAAGIRSAAEVKNKGAQADLSYPADPQTADDWAARKAWLMDGQAIHGTSGLADFYFPALAALQADDQAEFSRQRDLLFKAIRTFLGDSQ